MKKYKFVIVAVKLGSIGNKKRFTVTRQAETWEAAQLALYDEYEHISIETVNGKKFHYTWPECINQEF